MNYIDLYVRVWRVHGQLNIIAGYLLTLLLATLFLLMGGVDYTPRIEELEGLYRG